jgi:hypothetical protein
MKRIWLVGVLLVLFGVAGLVHAEREESHSVVVTSTNAAANQLLVYDTVGALIQAVPTGGQGGVSGNAGGIAVRGNLLAIVNFGSGSVSLFNRDEDGFALRQVIAGVSAPVSVAFGEEHLYVLGTTTVESHRVRDMDTEPGPDGVAALLHADGSAAQVGVVNGALVITEKSNIIEVAQLRSGVVSGSMVPVDIPADSDAPFGLVTRGANAYVTIAHSDEITVIRSGQLVDLVRTGTPTGSGQHAPCWLALLGPYLYSANSPSHTLSRFIATGASIVPDEAVAARTNGAPTDIAAAGKRLAVIDSDGVVSRLTQFVVEDDGTLAPAATTVIASAAANGVAIITR